MKENRYSGNRLTHIKPIDYQQMYNSMEKDNSQLSSVEDGTVTIRYLYLKKKQKNLIRYLIIHPKNNSKWTTDLNVRAKMIKFQVEKHQK